MFLLALVLLGKDLFEPTGLFLGNPFIRRCWIVTDSRTGHGGRATQLPPDHRVPGFGIC